MMDAGIAVELAATVVDLLPDFELGRIDIARGAGVEPRFVEALYSPTTSADPAQLTALATFLGIDVADYVAHANRLLG